MIFFLHKPVSEDYTVNGLVYRRQEENSKNQLTKTWIYGNKKKLKKEKKRKHNRKEAPNK